LSVLRMDWPAWVAEHSLRAEDLDSSNDDNDNTISRNKAETKPSMTFPEGSQITESDCLAMGDAELDRYLDWYETNLASESVREHGRTGRDADFRRTLMRMFPTQSSSRPTAATSASSASNLTSIGEDRGGTGEDSPNLATTTTTTTQRLRQVQQNLRLKKIVVSGGGGENEADLNQRENDTIARVGSFYRRHRDAKEFDGPTRLLYTKAAGLAGVSLEGITAAVFATERKLQMLEERARRGGESDEDDGEEG
jgi:RNA polymerase I-specific transcription initiation factor RRN7